MGTNMRLVKSISAVFLFITLIEEAFLISVPDWDGDMSLSLGTCWADSQIHGSSCFKLFTDASTYQTAKEKCQEYGAQLAVVKDDDTNDFVATLKGSEEEVWIGLRRNSDEIWKWIDGTSLEESFHDWAEGWHTRHGRCVLHGVYTNYQNVWKKTDCARLYSYVCQKAVQCVSPSLPENGNFIASPGFVGSLAYQPNDVLHFTCNPGHNLDGAPALTCRADGTWSASPPVCRVVQCPILTNPANGDVSGSNSYGDRVQFECNWGYTLVGEDSLTCKDTGHWNGNAPTCKGCPVADYVSFNGVCYKDFSERREYNGAKQRCAEDGGLLAMPKDRATNDFFSDLWNDYEFRWLGLSDNISEGIWVFEDGRTLTSSGFANWNQGEPNGYHNENCAALWSGSWWPWIDASCTDHSFGFICQLDQDCRNQLGMESGAIPDGSITASSYYSNHPPYHARLNRASVAGAWIAYSAVGQWLQVYLGEIKRVTGTIIQGRYNYDQWVTSYKLQYGVNWTTRVTYEDSDGTAMVFPGNRDRNTPVTNLLTNPVDARYVRFLPQTWHRHICMRAEILGCSTNVHCNALTNPTNGVVSGSNAYGAVLTFTCNTGYSLDGPATLTCQADGTWSGSPPTCKDVDECASPNGGCGQNMICTNTIGSYLCSCLVGYHLETGGSSCEDVDECAVENGGCDQICTNEIGSFQCSCGSGYVWNADNRQCDDVDECMEVPGICGHYLAVCTNNIGNFECTCSRGYAMVSGGCHDVDECAVGEYSCAQHAVCQNTDGSYLCTCKDGFIGDGTSCTEIQTTTVKTTQTMTTTSETTSEPETSHPNTSPLPVSTSTTSGTGKSTTLWQEETTSHQVTSQPPDTQASTTDPIAFGGGDQIDLDLPISTSWPTMSTEPQTTEEPKLPGFWPGLTGLVNGQAETGEIQQYLNDDGEEETRLAKALDMVYSQSSDLDSAEKVELLAKATDILLTSSGELNLNDQATGGFIVEKMAKSIEELSENGVSFPQLRPAASAVVDTVSTLVEAGVEEDVTVKDESHLLPPRKRKAYKEKLEEELLEKKEEQWKLKKEAMSALTELIDHIASALMSSHAVPGSATLGKKKVQLALKKESELGEEPVSLPAGKVDLPTDDAFLPFSSSSDVGWKITGFNDNPYVWDRTAGDIKSSVLDVTLGDVNGNEIPVNGLSKAITIVLKNRPEMLQVGHLVNYKHYGNDTMAFRDFQALENATYGVTLTVRTAAFIREVRMYGKLGGDPNDTDHDFRVPV
ncbi:FBN2 [Branchiostoma lanceolatum]|uniref:FBN2 protein n=1 Tax=Branchiostoma lanceolatum TaxID=7740 RepID=A0A8K0E8I8_BRALA|nr:FBN2 [Branchiostoma lanceolatum]